MKYMLLALALTAGCGSVIPSGIARLHTLSPLEADPRDIGVALDLPEGVGIVPRSAQMTMNAERSDTGAVSKEIYVLASKTSSGGKIIYTIADADFARLQAQQTLIRGWKSDAEGHGTGSIGVTILGCAIGNGPAEDAVMSINIRTEEGATFFPLIRRAPIADVLELTEMGDLEPCAY